MDKQVEEILHLLNKCTVNQRKLIFAELRKEFKIHALEEKLNTQAEIILEAINKDEKGLTFRMIRGVIAEAAFNLEVIAKLKGWVDVTPNGDLPYDYLLQDTIGKVSIQVKLQRSKDLRAMTAKQAYKRFSNDLYVVETQKTRGGKDEVDDNTRPYKFNEFDILAVSMQPSTGSWSNFMYTPSNWLIPQEANSSKILKFQPVSPSSNKDWTNDFETCVKRLRQDIKNTIDS